MQATARMASVVSSTLPARRRLIRDVRPNSQPMSLRICRSIRGSFGDAEQKQADKLLLLLNHELRSRGLPAFIDGAIDEAGLRNLPCGSVGASTLHALTQLAAASKLTWGLGNHVTERWIALPMCFEQPFSIRHGRLLFCIPIYQKFFSLPTILSEISALADPLGIPLDNGSLSDWHAARIADNETLCDSEPEGFKEDERSLWLELYLAATYCIEDSTPLLII